MVYRLDHQEPLRLQTLLLALADDGADHLA